MITKDDVEYALMNLIRFMKNLSDDDFIAFIQGERLNTTLMTANWYFDPTNGCNKHLPLHRIQLRIL